MAGLVSGKKYAKSNPHLDMQNDAYYYSTIKPLNWVNMKGQIQSFQA